MGSPQLIRSEYQLLGGDWREGAFFIRVKGQWHAIHPDPYYCAKIPGPSPHLEEAEGSGSSSTRGIINANYSLVPDEESELLWFELAGCLPQGNDS